MTVTPTVLLIAINARPYLKALKQAGFNCIVIDGFLDQETRFFADEAHAVPFNAQGFDASLLLAKLEQILAHQAVSYCLYGAGFEAQPALLKKIASRVNLIGNTAEINAVLKSPEQFFSALATLAIPFPLWQWQKPETQMKAATKWLKKTVGGSGGSHITLAAVQTDEECDEVYYQAQVEGQSLSVQFLAYPTLLHDAIASVEIIGIHTQWPANDADRPFKMGGLAVVLNVSDSVHQQLVEVLTKVTKHFGLLGLNSLDVIVEDGVVKVLELNPRLSLSLELYLHDYNVQVQVNLLALHVKVCLLQDQLSAAALNDLEQASTKLMAYDSQLGSSRALGVVYAPNHCYVPVDTPWPDWVVDRPNQSAFYEAGQPVCSVVAKAPDEVAVRAEILKKAAQVITSLQTINE